MFYAAGTKCNIRFKTFRHYSEVEKTWKDFLPIHHHLASPDILALELSKPEDIEFMYVHAYDNDKLIAVIYLQCLDFNSKHYNHSVFERPFLKQIKNNILKRRTKLLICGNLFRVNFQGFYFADKADYSMIFDTLQLYRKSLPNNRQYSGMLLKDCSREFSPVQFNCHRFKAFKQDLTMELNLSPDWKTFDDYLKDLSRKYRQRANKIIQSKSELSIEDMDLTRLENEKSGISELYMNIVAKQNLALGILNADYFLNMKARLGERFKVYGYYLGSKLLAFSSHILYPQKNTMEIHYIGIDYTKNKQYNLYFNILFDGIKSAISYGYKTIEMGRTAREAKANAGAHAVENFNYIWIKPGIISLAFRFLGNWFDQTIGEDWKLRNPFKSSQESKESLPIVQN